MQESIIHSALSLVAVGAGCYIYYSFFGVLLFMCEAHTKIGKSTGSN